MPKFTVTATWTEVYELEVEADTAEEAQQEIQYRVNEYGGFDPRDLINTDWYVAPAEPAKEPPYSLEDLLPSKGK